MASLAMASAATVLGGCAGPQVAERGRVEVALARSGRWTTFTVQAGRVFGASGSMELRGDKITGRLDGTPIRLEVGPRETTGSAGGQVAFDVDESEGKTEISGVWNDERLHFEITPESLRGTITGAALGHCQYVLDRVELDGTRVGTSICAGMPADTRLDFPGPIEKLLGKSQRVALLLLLLASPPATSTERGRGGW
jgi:hypothetical protein